MTKPYKSHRRLLTDQFCTTARPGVYTDTGCPGLKLNVSGLARKTFQHVYQVAREGKMSEAGTGNRLRGKIKKLLIGHFPAMSLASARALVVTQRILTTEGINPRDSASTAATNVGGVDMATSSAPTFATVVEQFNVNNEQKIAARKASDLKKYILPHIGNFEFAKITRLQVGEVLTKIDAIAMAETPPKRTRAERMLKAIGSVFTYGRKIGLREDSPTAHLDFKRKPVGPNGERVKKRVLDHGELRKLWDLTEDDSFGAAFRFLLLSGLRRSEVSLMKFADVDMLHGVWTIPAEDAKIGDKEVFENRALRLSDALLAIIDAQPRNGPFVFSCRADGSAPVSGWGRWKGRISTKAKLPKWKTHNLRTTFITSLLNQGIGLSSISTVTGHSLPAAISSYVGDTPEEQHRVLETWAAYIFPPDKGTVVALPKAGAA